MASERVICYGMPKETTTDLLKHAACRGTNWCPLNPEHWLATEPSLTSKAESLSNAAACTGTSSPVPFNDLLCYTPRVLLAL